jgi:hypothetical protein
MLSPGKTSCIPCFPQNKTQVTSNTAVLMTAIAFDLILQRHLLLPGALPLHTHPFFFFLKEHELLILPQSQRQRRHSLLLLFRLSPSHPPACNDFFLTKTNHPYKTRRFSDSASRFCCCSGIHYRHGHHH